MALDANTYGTVAFVESMVGDMVDLRTFTDSTVPTVIQVETFLDLVADELNMVLKVKGYDVPVVEATDPETYGWLQKVNSMGASALVLGSLPQSMWREPEADVAAQSRRMFFENQVIKAGQRIEEGSLPAARTPLSMHELTAGSATDDDGNVKKPIFKRGILDYPGARTLTTSTEETS